MNLRPGGMQRRTQPARKAPVRINRPRKESGPSLPLNPGGAVKGLVFFLASVLILGMLGTGLIYTYRLVTTTPALGLTEISVSGNQRLAYGQVLEIAGLRLGQNSLGVNVTRVEAALSQNPWVEFVTVRRELPDKLFITLVERQPSFWVRQDGQLYFADGEGKIITQLTPGDSASLPLLEIAPELGDRREVVAAMVARMNKQALPFALGQMAWVKFTESGQVELYLDALRIRVRAELNDWPTHFDRIETVWRDLKLRGETGQVMAIEASGGKISVEKRQKPGPS
ncbi:MAG TPA: FtsQ-type POTRA domain-containing protein [Humidesulfovibrio sp.]|uniref:cell division protein FtsQ/DivIB n=1 Tax=Humidesulfovibrio sp. TaxID=2910988 RepID=UPI002C673DF7|nr:FtsQ-type POTRA domain-containing protein [Humidesulfovibrio sp.]HWR04255.1 FtsQ-type POTRA domain-containing protein [Humidesulfovibrio sp.]